MREMTKKEFERRVNKTILENYAGIVFRVGKTKLSLPVHASLETMGEVLLDAIAKGYDKIRINDTLHITVKKSAGGKYRHIPSGEIRTRGPSHRAVVVGTSNMRNVLHKRTNLGETTIPVEAADAV